LRESELSELAQGLILGAVQGITEWLPISSEGINTIILVNFFKEAADKAIVTSIWLHLGTFLAALVYFRKDVVYLLGHLPQYIREKGSSQRAERNTLITFLIVSTLLTGLLGAPLLLAGLELGDLRAGTIMAIVGAFLILTGVVQRLTRKSSGTRTITGFKDAAILGVVQAFSALPGLSRSGLTISAFLFRGFESRQAIRLSFLMSMPVILAAEIGLLLLNKVSLDTTTVIGILPAFVLGVLTIGVLTRLATRVAFWKFCLFVGVLSLIPLLIEIL
jgi:undecaprenyl-diphosphatase